MVACDAPFEPKERIPLLLFFGDGIFLSSEIAVEGRIRCDERLFELRDGIGDGGLRDALIVDACELCFVGGVVELFDQIGEVVAHLDRIDDGASGLLLQILGASVPELSEVEKRIEDGWSVDAPFLSTDTDGYASPVVTAVVEIVAAGTGDRTVGREDRIEKERFAKLHFGRIHGDASGQRGDRFGCEYTYKRDTQEKIAHMSSFIAVL